MSAVRKSCLALLVAAALVPAADPTLLSLVMPEARMISGFNVAQAKSSPFGQFLLSQMPSADASFQKFIDATGFDPRRDLQEILVAASGGPESGQGLLLVRGYFDPAKIHALAKQHGATIVTYKGVDVITGGPASTKWPADTSKRKTTAWVAFLDNSIVVLGDADTVRGVIDRRAGGPGPDAQLAAKVHEVSSLYDIWGVSMVPAAEWAGKVPDEKVRGAIKGDVLRAVEQTSGGVRFGPDIEVSGEAVTRSEKDAAALADVIRFISGLIQMNQKDPNLAGPVSLLQSLDLQTQGNVTRVSLKIPEAELEKLILAAKAKRAQASAKKQSPARRRPPRDTGLTIHSSEMGTVEIKPQ